MYRKDVHFMAVKKNSKNGKWQFDGKIYIDGKAVYSYRESGFATKKEAIRAEIEYREKFMSEYNVVRFEDLYKKYLPL